MKTTFLFLLFISQLAFAQVDSLLQQLQYYPLHIGNYWEFYIKTTEFGVEPKESKYIVEVLGDSLMPNGELYNILKKENIYPDNNKIEYYQRIDTTLGHVFQYSSISNDEFLILNLFADPWGSLEYPNYSLYSTEQKLILGTQTTVQTFFHAFGMSSFTYQRFAKGFGYSGKSRSTSSSSSSENLVFARINGIEYTGVDPSFIMQTKYSLDQFYLHQNYPNPFNQSTIIHYSLHQRRVVILKIYDLLGKVIETLVHKNHNAGSYAITFDSRNLPSGAYFYRLESNGFIQTKKMLIIN